MTPLGFETTISAGERPQTYAIDLGATGVACGAASDWKYVTLSDQYIDKEKLKGQHVGGSDLGVVEV
jgi:hypothetical protein